MRQLKERENLNNDESLRYSYTPVLGYEEEEIKIKQMIKFKKPASRTYIGSN